MRIDKDNSSIAWAVIGINSVYSIFGFLNSFTVHACRIQLLDVGRQVTVPTTVYSEGKRSTGHEGSDGICSLSKKHT